MLGIYLLTRLYQIKMNEIYVGMCVYCIFSFTPEVPVHAINAWSSSVRYVNKKYGPMSGWATPIKKKVLFISKYEWNPWIRFQMNRDTVITSITVVNRKDCCGQRLVNLEIRAGMANNMNNQVVGFFKGPGQTNKEYTIRLSKEVKARYISIQMKATGYLQINGIKLNLESIKGNIKKPYIITFSPILRKTYNGFFLIFTC